MCISFDGWQFVFWVIIPQILRILAQILRFRRIYRKNRRISQKSTADSAICANFAES
ncbi:hypothetical protein ACWIUD_03380 [Helicobacter sp. 23-1044]